MATDSQVLKEYLVALGFRVNETEHKKFTGSLVSLDKKAMKLGKTVVGVATAVVTFTTLFAKQMERLYYASRYAGTTAENLQVIEYGAQQIGLEGGKATAALKNMAGAIRSNPGLVGLLNNLGVKVTGRDRGQVMMDLVGALKSMPFYQAERYAALFGMDPETLFNLEQGLDDMKKAEAERIRMNQEMGLDANAAAEAGKEYMNMWREVVARATAFSQVLGLALLPRVRELLGVTDEVLKKWAQIVKDINRAGAPGLMQGVREGVTGVAEGPRVELSEDAKRRIGAPRKSFTPMVPHERGGLDVGKGVEDYRRIQLARDKQRGDYAVQLATDPAAVDAVQDLDDFKSKRPPGGAASSSSEDTTQGATPDDVRKLFAALEKQYDLPPGILDRMWLRESSRGKKMLSPKGAKGHFGFMDDTAKEYDLQDPNDLSQSAMAAAEKMSDLLRRYHGDPRLAAAAYNYGDGNLAKINYNLGAAPKETRDYADAVGGPPVSITNNTEINIHGVNDPQEAGKAAARETDKVNNDTIRNFKAKVR